MSCPVADLLLLVLSGPDQVVLCKLWTINTVQTVEITPTTNPHYNKKLDPNTKMESKQILNGNSLSNDPELHRDQHIEEKKKSFWKKVPFIGLILIVLKNVLNGVSDIVIKEMPEMEPVTLIFFRSTVMLSIVIPLSIVKDQPPFPPGLTVRERVLQVLRWRSSH